MHILFLSDNFPPEGNAPATRTFEHVREWVRNGHRVTVITCTPNFPEGKIYKGYRNKWLSKERIEGVDVWRVKTYITANEGFVRRSLDFVSFMLSSFFFGLFTKRVDVVIGTSPQFFTVVSAWALAKLKRVPYIFELRDIWPASLTAVGVMQSGKIIGTLEKLEMFLYSQSDLIVSVTHSFKKDLICRGVDGKKIKVVTNGVDTAKYQFIQKNTSKFAKFYELEDKFVAGYIGTMGLAHALHNILDAAALLSGDDSIRFVLAGGGADRARIEQLILERGLENIVLIPRQPKEEMPELWSLCNVSIVNLKSTPIFKTVIPSKIFESMAMGIPIVLAVPDGEAADLIRTTNTGVTVPPEDASSLACAIKSLKDGRLYHSYHISCLENIGQFDRTQLALELLYEIESLVD